MLVIRSFFSIFLSVLFFVFSCANVQAQEETTTSTTSTQGPQENTVTTTTLQPSNDGTTTTKVVETRHTIVTTVPTPNEVISTPEGYVSCLTTEAGWHNDVWVPSHKVCKYENSSQGVAWIESYWKCNKATATGVCIIWEWTEGHWEKTFTTY